MTFKEWYTNNEIKTYDKTEYDCMKMAWNAAIHSSLEVHKYLVKRQIDENDFHVYLYEDIKKLLTDS